MKDMTLLAAAVLLMSGLYSVESLSQSSSVQPSKNDTVDPSKNSQESLPKDGITATSPQTFKDCPECPTMVKIPAGNFVMGNERGEEDERLVHQVEIAAFAMSQYEITRKEFQQFVAATGYKTKAETSYQCHGWVETRWEKSSEFNWNHAGFPQEENHPVVCVGWNDGVAYTQWLSQKTGKVYRLPTEAEWEYAARAGTKTPYYWGEDVELICGYGNVADQTLKEKREQSDTFNCKDGYSYTAPIGSFKPNGFGLYDVSGNVLEWACSRYIDHYEGSELKCDITDEGWRVLRGSSWGNGVPTGVSFTRRSASPVNFSSGGIGLRVVVSLR